MENFFKITEIINKYNQNSFLEQSFKFKNLELLDDFRPLIWLIPPINPDCLDEILELYNDYQLNKSYELINEIAFSFDLIYINYSEAMNFPNKYIKITKEGLEEYKLIHSKDPLNFPINEFIKPLLKLNEFERYFIVENKKVDYPFYPKLKYQPNYYLDILKEYVDNILLRHIQIQKDYIFTFYFQNFNKIGIIRNKEEWDEEFKKKCSVSFETKINYYPNLIEDDTEKLYDKSSKQFRKILGSGMHYHAGSKGEIDSPVILDIYKYIGTNKRIFDIGCGWGGTLNMIRRDLSPSSLDGITNSFEQFNYCRNNLKLFNVYHGNINKINFPGNYDCVLLIESYSHMHPENRKRLLKRIYNNSEMLIMNVNCNRVKNNGLTFADTMHVPEINELRNDIIAAGFNIKVFEDIRTKYHDSIGMWYFNLQKIKKPSYHAQVLKKYCEYVLINKNLWNQQHPLMQVVAVKKNTINIKELSFNNYTCDNFIIKENSINYLEILEEVLNRNFGKHPLNYPVLVKGMFANFDVKDLSTVYGKLGNVLSIPLKSLENTFHLGNKIIYSISIIESQDNSINFTLNPHYDTYYTIDGKNYNNTPLYNSITYLSGCNYDNGSLVIYDNEKEYTVYPRPGRTCILFGKVKHAVKPNFNYTRIALQVALFKI